MDRELRAARRLSPKAKRSYIEFTYILPFLLLVAAYQVEVQMKKEALGK